MLAPLWNFSSMGGTIWRTLPKISLVAADISGCALMSLDLDVGEQSPGWEYNCHNNYPRPRQLQSDVLLYCLQGAFGCCICNTKRMI